MEDLDINSKIKLSLVAIIWGFTFSATKIGLNFANSYTYNFFRFLIAAIILLPFLKKLSRKDIYFSIIFSLIYSFSVAFQTLSLVSNQTINTSNLMGTSLIMTSFLGYVVLREKPNLIKIVAVLLGIGLLTNFKFFYNGRGDFFAMISALFYGFQIFLISYVSRKRAVNFLGILFYQSIVAVFLNLILILIFGFEFEANVLVVGSLMYNAIFSLIIATILQFKYQKNISLYEASIIYIISDIIIIVLGFIMGERVILSQLIGCLLIISTPFINTSEFKKGE